MDALNIIAGSASIVALIITIWQQCSINSTKKEVNKAIHRIHELHKRATLNLFLGTIREITRELTSISNGTSRGRYRGGIGNELKTKLENFIGDLLEESLLLTPEQIVTINTLSDKIKIADFKDIETNKSAAREINENFSKLRQDFSEYLSPHTLAN